MNKSMNIGSLYLVKSSYFWLLFPTKEIAAEARSFLCLSCSMADDDLHLTAPDGQVAIWSRELKCEVTYFSPNEYIVFLEEDGIYKKVLTSDGKIGWTWFGETYNEFFEEV